MISFGFSPFCFNPVAKISAHIQRGRDAIAAVAQKALGHLKVQVDKVARGAMTFTFNAINAHVEMGNDIRDNLPKTPLGQFLTQAKVGQLVCSGAKRIGAEKMAMMTASWLYSSFCEQYVTGETTADLMKCLCVMLPVFMVLLRRGKGGVAEVDRDLIPDALAAGAIASSLTYFSSSYIDGTTRLVTRAGGQFLAAFSGGYVGRLVTDPSARAVKYLPGRLPQAAGMLIFANYPTNWITRLGCEYLLTGGFAGAKYFFSPNTHSMISKAQHQLEAQVYATCFHAIRPFLKDSLVDAFAGSLQLLSRDMGHVLFKGLRPYASLIEGSASFNLAFQAFKQTPGDAGAYADLEEALIQTMESAQPGYRQICDGLSQVIEKGFLAQEARLDDLLKEYLQPEGSLLLLDERGQQYLKKMGKLLLTSYILFVLQRLPALSEPMEEEDNHQFLLNGAKLGRVLLEPILGSFLSKWLETCATKSIKARKAVRKRIGAERQHTLLLPGASRHVEVARFFLELLPELQVQAQSKTGDMMLSLASTRLGKRLTARFVSSIQALSGDTLNVAVKSLNKFASLLRQEKVSSAYAAFQTASPENREKAYQNLEQTVFNALNQRLAYKQLYHRHKRAIEQVVNSQVSPLIRKNLPVLRTDQREDLEQIARLFLTSFGPFLAAELRTLGEGNPITLGDNRALSQSALEAGGIILERFIGPAASSLLAENGKKAIKWTAGLELANDNPVKSSPPSLVKRFTLDLLLAIYTFWLKLCSLFSK